MATLDTLPGLSAALGDVKSFLATEEDDSSETDSDLEDSIPAPPVGGGMLRIVPAESGDQKDRKEPRAVGIKITEAQQAEWLRSREFLRQLIHNFAQLIVLDEVADLTKELTDTPAGKYEGF